MHCTLDSMFDVSKDSANGLLVALLPLYDAVPNEILYLNFKKYTLWMFVVYSVYFSFSIFLCYVFHFSNSCIFWVLCDIMTLFLFFYSGHGLSGMAYMSIVSFIMTAAMFAAAIPTAFIMQAKGILKVIWRHVGLCKHLMLACWC